MNLRKLLANRRSKIRTYHHVAGVTEIEEFREVVSQERILSNNTLKMMLKKNHGNLT